MMASAYYNEIDPYAAQWLRNLIAAGIIPDGDVDERSIVDVDPADLAGYSQCHFFAGIGGWPYALRLAGWPDDRPVWTGSCPCQPISRAGRRKGHADERHLWPAFYDLIAECRPATVFGEQVAGALGREWLAGVRADLEDAGYAVGCADLCAACVGAPHIRQRLFWVADADRTERGPIGAAREAVSDRHDSGRSQAHGQLGACREVRGVADSANGVEQTRQSGESGQSQGSPGGYGLSSGLGIANGTGSQPGEQAGASARQGDSAFAASDTRRLGDATHGGCEEKCSLPGGGDARNSAQGAAERFGASYWSRAEWLECLDGKSRRVEPGFFPLAHAGEWGSGSRVGILRGAGNAIVPQVAAEFIAGFLDARL